MSNQEGKEQAGISKLSDGIILAAFPALGYGMAYLHQFRHFDHFGIPPQFVEVSISTILIVSLSLLGALYALFFIGNGLVAKIKITASPLLVSVYSCFAKILFIGIYLVVARPSHWLIYILGTTVLFGFLISFFHCSRDEKSGIWKQIGESRGNRAKRKIAS